MAEERKREVGCLALTFFFDFLAGRGIDRLTVLKDLPYPPEFFDDRLNWMDYPTFLEIERRVGALFPGEPELFFHIGRSIGTTRGFGFMRLVARSFVSPFDVYSRLPTMVNRFLFPFADIKFTPQGPDRLRGSYRFHDGYPPSDAFVDTVRGILTAAPVMLEAPEAEVTCTRVGTMEARFDIVVHGWVGPGERLRGLVAGMARFFKRLRLRLGETADELEQTNHLLTQKVEDLTVTSAELDRRVRDLSVLNTIARAATSQLDVGPMLRAVVDAVSEALGGAPAAVMLAEGDPPGMALVSSRGVDRAALTALRALIQPGNPVTEALLSGVASDVPLGEGLSWVAVPLQSHDRVLGALILDSEHGSLLAAIAAQLAVAVDNATSYRVIADLRDHLEVRVKERTAELEEARTSLEDTVVQLERADRAKDDFFTNVSHELRTPLTLILAPLDDIEIALGTGNARESVGNVRRNARALLHLVNEMLDAAKLKDGRMPMEKVDVDVTSLLADVVATLRPLADRKQITLTTEGHDVPLSVCGDPKLLRRVVVNLVSNAIKYVDLRDHVAVRMRDEDGMVVFEVADTGPGIAMEDQARIFERFHRAAEQEGRRTEGTGIGLSMAQNIVEAHGGTIALWSERGRGSTFTVRLPRQEPAQDAIATPVHGATEYERELTSSMIDEPVPAAQVQPQNGSGGRVLLVEDNPEMRDFLVRIIGQHHRVTAVPDGQAGIEAAVAELPDVVVSDVMMPRMDGYEMCRRLKAEPATQNIPVILVSARHGTEAALRGFSAGADDYVVKPFSSPELLARIGAQIRIRQLAMTVMRMEKQTTLGVLSAGIAHEVLNPLNAVTNSVAPLRKVMGRMEGGEREKVLSDRLLDAIDHSAGRIRRIVDAILTFTRQEEVPRLAETMLSKDIESVLSIVGYRFQGRVSVRTEIGFDGPVFCYPELLDQVIMNLVTNAADALIEHGGSEILITTDRVDDEVVIRVSDDGPGIPAHLREKVFVPFYTSKPPGQGTGLGLAVSREIIQLHKGSLELAPEAGGGAEFIVRFPVAAASVEAHRVSA